MAETRVWVTFTREYTWHVGLEHRVFSAGKTCGVSAEVAAAAYRDHAAEPSRDPSAPARPTRKRPAKTAAAKPAVAKKTPARKR